MASIDTTPGARQAGNESFLSILDELERLLNKDERGEALGLIQETQRKLQQARAPEEAVRSRDDAIHEVIQEATRKLIELQRLDRGRTEAVEPSQPTAAVQAVHPYFAEE